MPTPPPWLVLPALLVVVGVGLYLLGLGLAALLAPGLASRFLLGFASSARAHYAELLVRVLVGGSLMVAAPRLAASGVWAVFGGVLVATSLVMLCLPWRWHQRFAQRSVPAALRHVAWVGVGALAAGAGLLGAVVVGAG